jgi:hypothetical protein
MLLLCRTRIAFAMQFATCYYWLARSLIGGGGGAEKTYFDMVRIECMCVVVVVLVRSRRLLACVFVHAA